jgi:hypothetical protein
MHRSRTSRLTLLVVLAGPLAAAAIPAAASAATQRYASPTGSGAACSSASPCSVREAVEAASSGDEVVVAPGDYPLTTPGLSAGPGITVHGVAGQPRPRLLFNNAPTPAMQLFGASTLRYVEVDQAPGTQGIALGVSDSTLDQVIVRGTGLDHWQTVATQHNTTIRNSIVIAPGSHGTAIATGMNGVFASGTFRNVTAIATESGGVAIRAVTSGPAGYANILARNVIARGGSGGASFEARTDGSGATAKITVGNSNWLGGSTVGSNASILDGGGNQSSTPAFVSAAAGDYRQAAGSPTIDAGLDEIINGPVDVDGDPRQIGGIDIGADEFVVAPTATTGTVGVVTDRSATLSGSVNPQGAPTTYHFEYGPTTAYGSVTPIAQAGSGGAVSAAATLGALSPATTYHYRVVATNAGGVVNGADRTFATTAAPAATAPATSTTTPPTASPSTTSTPQPPFAGVRLASTSLSFALRRITVTLKCPAATAGRCTGRTKLTARQRRTGSRPASRIALGRAPFSIAAGKRAKVRVRVSRPGRRLLGRTPRLAGKATNAARDGAGQTKTTATKVTIRRGHR